MTRLPRSRRRRAGPVAVALVASLAALRWCTATATDPGQGAVLRPPARSGSSRSTRATRPSPACAPRRRRSSARTASAAGSGPRTVARRRRGEAPPRCRRRPIRPARRPWATRPGAPNYSGTNTHEAGVDEPDMVKTDGRRIVTVSGGVLRVVDAGQPLGHRLRGPRRRRRPQRRATAAADILLSGDHALILMQQSYMVPRRTGPVAGRSRSRRRRTCTGRACCWSTSPASPACCPRWSSTASLVDARQVGSTARVVIRSAPRITFPYLNDSTDKRADQGQKSIIDHAPLDLLAAADRGHDGRRDPHIERALRRHQPAGVVHRDQPAHRSSPSTWPHPPSATATDHPGRRRRHRLQQRAQPVHRQQPDVAPAAGRRRSQAGRRADRDLQVRHLDAASGPRYVAGGSVPGYLINQYAMSRMRRQPAGRHHDRRVERSRAGRSRACTCWPSATRRCGRSATSTVSARASASTPCASSGPSATSSRSARPTRCTQWTYATRPSRR